MPLKYFTPTLDKEPEKERAAIATLSKNQELYNYFKEAYMKYLNPSGLAKKPSMESLHIKISV